MSIDETADIIYTDRLELVAMSRRFLEASVAGERELAMRLLGAVVDEEWWEARWLAQLRLRQLYTDPELQPWLLRAMVRRAGAQNGARRMVGHIGFHMAPGGAYLKQIAPEGVEFGYRVYAPYRRRGYATEASAALMAWAAKERGVEQFVLSINPENEPSLRIAHHFGFRKVSSRIGADGAVEDVFVYDVARDGRLTGV